MVKQFLSNNKLTFFGIVIGAIAGYSYYYFVGCISGCAITSKPLNSSLYGSFMGGLLINSFQKTESDKV